jgi:hypothetical protein
MLQTVTGIYDNGRIMLNEHLKRKHSKIIVTFIDEDDGLKLLSKIPVCFRKPVRVAYIESFSRDELHER